MRWLVRLVLAVLVLAVLGAAGFAASGLLSLDWERRHRAETEALPSYSETGPDGLVRLEARGMSFRARVAGISQAGDPIIMLHGFPETSAMWEPLIARAAAAGYRVLAVDQRGYSPGARPEGVDAYAVPELAEDVLALADAAGFERFHLVGHDWGCVVGWAVAIEHPERVLSWSGLSIPHPGTLLAGLSEELPAYIKIFTAPFVAETLLSTRDFANLRETYADAAPAQRDEYLAVFSEPGALTAALNWYRAITRGLSDGERVAGPVRVPTLFLYGTREDWVNDEALVQQRDLVTASYEERVLDAGHFLMHEKPDIVIEAIMAHLGAR